MHYLSTINLWFFLCHLSFSSAFDQTSLQMQIKNYKELEITLHGIDGLLNLISDPEIDFVHTQSVVERLKKRKTWTLRRSPSVVLMPKLLEISQPETISILFNDDPKEVEGTLQLLQASAYYNVSYLEIPRDTDGQIKLSYFKLVDSSNLDKTTKIKIKLLMTAEDDFDEILDLVTEGQMNDNLVQYAVSKLTGSIFNMERPANIDALRSLVSLVMPESLVLRNTSLFDPQVLERTIQILQEFNVSLQINEIDQMIYYYQTNQLNESFIISVLKSLDTWHVWSPRSVSSLPIFLNLVPPKVLELIFDDVPSKVPDLLDTISIAANSNVSIELFKINRKSVVTFINDSKFDSIQKIKMKIATSPKRSTIDDILDLVTDGKLGNDIVQTAVAKLSILEYKGKMTWVLNKSKNLSALLILMRVSKPTTIIFKFEESLKTGADIIELLHTAGQLNIDILVKEYLLPTYEELVENSKLSEADKNSIINILNKTR